MARYWLACSGPCGDQQGRTWCQVPQCAGHADKRVRVARRRGRDRTPFETNFCNGCSRNGTRKLAVIAVVGDAPRRREEA
ncbi:hypothetical protein GCM10020216_084790 [Nonomuraea helvata]